MSQGIKIIAGLIVMSGVSMLIVLIMSIPNVELLVTDASLTEYFYRDVPNTGYYVVDLGVTVRNPSEKTPIYYDSMEAVVKFKDQEFVLPLTPFYQKPKNSTNLHWSFQGPDFVFVKQKWSVSDLLPWNWSIWDTEDFIEIHWAMGISFKIWFIKLGNNFLTSSCDIKLPTKQDGAKYFSTVHTAKCDISFLKFW